MKLFAGTACQKLAEKIGNLGNVELSRYPNGENKVWIKDDCRNEDVFILQNFSQPVDQNIMQFCLMVDAVKRLHPKKIIGVIPWLGYAKQNKVFRKGESLAAEVVARLVSSSGAHEIVLFDVHSENVKGFFSVPVAELSAMDLFIDYIKEKCEILNTDFVVVSPDGGALIRNKYAAEKLGVPLFVIDKERDLETGKITIRGINELQKKIRNSKSEIRNSSVLMFDDMILSGATVIHDTEYVKSLGAKNVYFFATHLNASDKTFENLSAACAAQIVVTNSLEFDIPQDLTYKICQLDIASFFGNEIKKLLHSMD